jgi:hypothetical protein
VVSGAFLYEMDLFEYLLDGLPVRTGDIVATVDGIEVTFRGQVWRLVGAVMPGDIHHVLMYVGPGPRFIEAGPSGVIELEMPKSRWDSVPVADSRGGLMDRLQGVAGPLVGKRITGVAGVSGPEGFAGHPGRTRRGRRAFASGGDRGPRGGGGRGRPPGRAGAGGRPVRARRSTENARGEDARGMNAAGFIKTDARPERAGTSRASVLRAVQGHGRFRYRSVSCSRRMWYLSVGAS